MYCSNSHHYDSCSALTPSYSRRRKLQGSFVYLVESSSNSLGFTMVSCCSFLLNLLRAIPFKVPPSILGLALPLDPSFCLTAILFRTRLVGSLRLLESRFRSTTWSCHQHCCYPRSLLLASLYVKDRTVIVFAVRIQCIQSLSLVEPGNLDSWYLACASSISMDEALFFIQHSLFLILAQTLLFVLVYYSID